MALDANSENERRSLLPYEAYLYPGLVLPGWSNPILFEKVESGPIDLDLSCINNKSVIALVEFLREKKHPVSVIRHPEATITCDEKRDLFNRYTEYLRYGDLEVAKGSLLTWKTQGEDRFALVMSDGSSRIDFKEVKKILGLSKRIDLTMYRGEIEPILGLEPGGISALIEDTSKLDLIYFNLSITSHALHNHGCLWDFAFSSRLSVLASPIDVIDFFMSHSPHSKITKAYPKFD